MLEQGKGWFDSIKGTPLKDRIFVLMLFMIFLLVASLITVTIYFRDKEFQANTLKIEAERKVELLQSTNVKESKDYNLSLVEALKDCDSKWQLKFDNERNLNQKFLEEKANKLEQELLYLRNESRKIRTEANTLKKQVNQ